MVALDGRCVHLRSDGSVSRVPGDELTPFAAVTRFRPDIDHTEAGSLTRPQCEDVIHRLAGSDNLFHALRVDGHFPTIRTRTLSKQSKPYPRLADAPASAPVFTLDGVIGTIVGFHTPDYAQGIGAAGYHMLFLSADHQAGGLVFDFTVDSPPHPHRHRRRPAPQPAGLPGARLRRPRGHRRVPLDAVRRGRVGEISCAESS